MGKDRSTFFEPASRRANVDDRPAKLTYIAPVFRVSDLARSLDFYRGRLGFDLDVACEGFYASVRRDGCDPHLKCAAPAPRDQAAFEQAEHIDACIVVPDAAAFGSTGVPLAVPPRRMAYGVE